MIVTRQDIKNVTNNGDFSNEQIIMARNRCCPSPWALVETYVSNNFWIKFKKAAKKPRIRKRKKSLLSISGRAEPGEIRMTRKLQKSIHYFGYYSVEQNKFSRDNYGVTCRKLRGKRITKADYLKLCSMREDGKKSVKSSSDFYLSQEWRSIRVEILEEHGCRCMMCGRTPKDHGIVVHVDHIKPRSKYPELELEKSNLQVLCEDCNLGKSNKYETDYRQ